MLFRRNKRKNNSQQPIFTDKLESQNLELTSSNILSLIQHSSDVVFHDIYINGKKDLPVTMIYIDGLIDVTAVDQFILKPLTQEVRLGKGSIEEIIDYIEHGTVHHASQRTRVMLSECVYDIMDGSVALIFNQANKAIVFDVKGFEKRSISEPTGENVQKGAKDAFVEVLRTNTATIRRKIKSHNLIVEESKVGKQSLTKVAIVYLNRTANRHIVEELKKRLDKINVDGVLTTGIIEENIIDNKYSPFPQILYTERPDKFCANIIEGRVGIVIDGFPVAFVIPGSLNQFLQGPEDYSQNFIISSVLRFLRFVLMLETLFLPGFYIAVTTFHQEMIPTKLALSIIASKEGVPFPTFIEVAIMLISFEVLVEAGLRLPKNIGQAISIVGALVVGQAAVEARLVSPAVVVVIAMTAIASFTMPNQDFSNALRLWRFIFVIITSIIGLYGLSIGGIVLLLHLSKMEVYGVPYLSPFVADENKQMQDTLVRLPFSFLSKRPVNLKTTNKNRTD